MVENKKICYSGGAKGSDYYWGEASKILGFEVFHYFHGSRTPYGNIEVHTVLYDEGVEMVHRANKSLHRRPENFMNLLARNWAQVKNAEAIFAIATLATPSTVSGGTGWAVQMAIDENKPVYLFDQNCNYWLSFNYDSRVFERCPNPQLTNHFAGIGTREINENGKDAIRQIMLGWLELELLNIDK